LPKTPKELRCDNEAALISIPHKRVIPNPVYSPNFNGKVERLHKELATLSRLHNTTPDKVIQYIKQNDTFALEGGEVAAMNLDKWSKRVRDHKCVLLSCNNDAKDYESKVPAERYACTQEHYLRAESNGFREERMAQDLLANTSITINVSGQKEPTVTVSKGLCKLKGCKKKAGATGYCCQSHQEKATYRREVAYDGREIEVGMLVMQKTPPRSRNKDDPYWVGPCRVTRRIGRRVYGIIDTYEGKEISRQIDHLKVFNIGDNIIKDLVPTPEAMEQARHVLGDVDSYDLKYNNMEVKLDDDWAGKDIYAAYPGIDKMQQLYEKLAKKDYRTCTFVMPDLPTEKWYQQSNSLSDAEWYGNEPKDNVPFWRDSSGRKVRSEYLTWWVGKVVGRG